MTSRKEKGSLYHHHDSVWKRASLGKKGKQFDIACIPRTLSGFVTYRVAL